MEISKAKMEGYRVIGIKDTDKEKLANHVSSSFSVQQEVEPVEIVKEKVNAPETFNQPVDTPVQTEVNAVSDETMVAEKPVSEETKVAEEENIFDRIAKESAVAEQSEPEGSVTLETPVEAEKHAEVEIPAQAVEGNMFDNQVIQEAEQTKPEVSSKEEAFDAPAVNVPETPSEFYGLENNVNVGEKVSDNVEVNDTIPVKEEIKSNVNVGAEALSALKALIEENESLKVENNNLKNKNEDLKAKINELAESINIANARTKAAETTLNEEIQRDVKTLN